MSTSHRTTQEEDPYSILLIHQQQINGDGFWYANPRPSSFFVNRASMDDITLCQLLQRVFQTQEGTQDHENAKEALALAIDQIPEIRRYLGQGWLPYYEQALPVTMRDVRKNINKFSIKYQLNNVIENYQQSDNAKLIRKKFINWVVMILKCDCMDVKRGRHLGEISLDNSIGKDNSTTIGDNIADSQSSYDIEKEELKNIGSQLTEYINSDPDNQLKTCHPKGYPSCNCQILSQRLLLKIPPDKLSVIAREFEISYQTLNSHWKRSCLPMLQKIANELGYE